MKRWILEFSKKLVVACSVFYFVIYITAFIAMYIKNDLSALSNMLDNLNTVLTTCVFGYLVKAGIENVFKIKKDKGDNENGL